MGWGVVVEGSGFLGRAGFSGLSGLSGFCGFFEHSSYSVFHEFFFVDAVDIQAFDSHFCNLQFSQLAVITKI